MPLGCPQVQVASFRLVNALYQAQLFQLLQGPVNRHQSQLEVIFTALVEDFDSFQGLVAVGEYADDRPARGGDAAAAFLQLPKPGLING